jgi:cytochrome P450
MMQQMSQLAQQQGNLNAQTESLFGQPQPGQNGQPSWQKLAAQQRAIREALNALRNEMARQQREALGDLGQIAGDMQKTAEELNKRRHTPEILKRQRQILSRLLDAQQSMRERGKSRKRQARAGENVAYKGPGSLPSDFGEADNHLRRHLRDALKEGYSAEYQALIRQYFEALIEDAQREQKSNE